MSAFRDSLSLPHGRFDPPVFLPDATVGVVRSVDSEDLEACGIRGLIMNTFHLMQRPGSSTIQALGGLHKMSGWRRPLVTDSGGFQAYSLIRENPRYGRLSDRGLTFQPAGSGRKFHLGPEKSVQLQLAYGADVVICLDDCTHADAPLEVQEESVRRTIEWARRGKGEFERIVTQKGLSGAEWPLIFGVIQGGASPELRRRCAEALLEIGFDGFGYGGWPLDAQGNLLRDILAYTRQLVPPAFPMHALGVGHPASIVECTALGYSIFDSALPTRDARHGRLFRMVLDDPAAQAPSEWFSYVYINDAKHIKSDAPIDAACDGLCCRRYSLGYLRHLFKIEDGLFMRLATIHNLRSMVRLTERLRAS